MIQVWISQWDGVQRFYYSNQVSFSSIFFSFGSVKQWVKNTCKFHYCIWSITLSFWLVKGLQFTLHQCATICEANFPLLNYCDAHGIITKSLMNLSGVTKHLAKFNAIPLPKSFCGHFVKIKRVFTKLTHSQAGCQWLTLTVDWKNILTCAWRYPIPLCRRTPSMLHLSPQDKLFFKDYIP